MAASAYVEEFGLEVFGRAEAAMRADKVTKFVRHYLINLDIGLILQQTNSRYLSSSRDVPRVMPGLEPPPGRSCREGEICKVPCREDCEGD